MLFWIIKYLNNIKDFSNQNKVFHMKHIEKES